MVLKNTPICQSTFHRELSVPLPWYALQVRTRYERVVAEHLGGQGFEWFLPLSKELKRWSDRIKVVESPLFPGYLFCRFDAQNRLPILKTPGLVQIVGYNRQPISVDDGEISAIQTLVASGVPNQPCSFVEIGDPVRIQSGPLQGLEGILVESRGRHKFVLSVTLLQRSVAVEIDSLSVTPCHRDSPAILREISDAVAV